MQNETVQTVFNGVGCNWRFCGDRLFYCAKYETIATVNIRLSNREVACINLLLQAYKMHEIAEQLGIAVRTVKAIFNKVYMKFGIDNKKFFSCVRLIYLLYHPNEIRREQ